MAKKFTGNKFCFSLVEFYDMNSPLYIGDEKTAYALTEKFKIEKFYTTFKNGTVANYGWSAVKGKNGHWYGWSHRAISSFSNKQKAIAFAKEVA